MVRNIRLFCLAFLLIFAVPLPSNATPPRAISVEDVLFGRSDTHVFLLRYINDNLEEHFTGLADVILVARSLDTGREDKFWPVRRMLKKDDGDSTTTESSRSFDILMEERINPFNVLADHGAHPISDSAARTAENATLPNWFAGGRLELGKWKTAPEFALPLSSLSEQINASMKATRKAMPAHAQGYDPLLNTTFSTPSKCEVARIFLARVNDAPKTLAKLRCFDPEEAVWAALYLAVPALKNP